MELPELFSYISDFVIAVVFIFAWNTERKERQELAEYHRAERSEMLREIIDLARQVNNLPTQPRTTRALSEVE